MIKGPLTIVISVALIILFSTVPEASAEMKLSSPGAIGGLSSPESVLKSPDGRSFYISNVGPALAPSEKDGDGFITEASRFGRIIKKRFLPRGDDKLDSPKGMALVGRTLYVADVDRLVGFDTRSRRQVFSMDLSSEGTVFLNDITVKSQTVLYVSATDIGKIFEVSLKDEGRRGEYKVLEGDYPGVNGLYYDKESSSLYLVGFGTADGKGGLGVIFYDKEYNLKYEVLTGPVGMLDGIRRLPGRRLLISDWVESGKAGRLIVYSIDTKEISEVELSSDVKGPADFYYDVTSKQIWLPGMVEGKVFIDDIE